MRGARNVPVNWACSSGIIPAYAGSTGRTSGTCGRRRDHPRVCGEHGRLLRGQLYGLGSSPRMRGARFYMLPSNHPPGIIPAYAGSTGRQESTSRRSRDHPRVCGEHTRSPMWTYSSLGSSPRMRGAPARFSRRGAFRRIIPAYAGSTHAQIVESTLCEDHPRVCGEHGQGSHGAHLSKGSSPRMRGEHHLVVEVRGDAGIIPAYAGSTDAR